jgi:putative nucleotidyltransferase with HDIG domain
MGGQANGELQLATVIALAEALDIRDTGTGQHSHTVGRYAELMARALGLGEERVERVRLAGVLHDIGKIGISDRVLSKAGPLDADEWQEMHTHPEIGARLLSRQEFDDLREWILAHHERPDGLGYPRGLKGDEIPVEARILAVADAYEAMTADRVYRPALGEEAARAELEAGAGTQFDARVVEALLSSLDAIRARTLRRVA